MHGDGEAHDGGAQVEALHHPPSRGGQQKGADETAGKSRKVSKRDQPDMILSAHPRLVATTMTLGEKRVERPMPEKRPARKLTQRVVVSEAA